jgi:phosphate transport system protein
MPPDPPPPAPHFEAQLQHDIDLIRAKLVEMALLDEQALKRACQAVLTRDRQLAYSVILRDQDVDALDSEIDGLCLQFLVRHQPAAGHLRFVYSAAKIVGDLERVGDYAESIARQLLMVSSLSFDVPVDSFNEIANLAIPMVHDAVRAFVDKNPDLARTTMAREPEVNRVRDRVTAELVERGQQGRLPLEALPPLINVARRLERVSDQATNICEEALYFATGVYSRHVPPQGFRVLFVDETNGCLSLMAEEIGGRLGAPRFAFASAGLTPGPIDPGTVRFLAAKGIDVSQRVPRSTADTPQFDQLQVIVALSKKAQAASQKPFKALVVQWLVPDPSKARGTGEEVDAAYEQAFESLTQHIRDLVQAILGNDEHLTNGPINAV